MAKRLIVLLLCLAFLAQGCGMYRIRRTRMTEREGAIILRSLRKSGDRRRIVAGVRYFLFGPGKKLVGAYDSVPGMPLVVDGLDPGRYRLVAYSMRFRHEVAEFYLSPGEALQVTLDVRSARRDLEGTCDEIMEGVGTVAGVVAAVVLVAVVVGVIIILITITADDDDDEEDEEDDLAGWRGRTFVPACSIPVAA